MSNATRDALFAEISDLIKKHSTADNLTLSDDVRIDTLGVDSIDLMEIIFRLEETHGVEINPRGLQGRETVGDIVDYAHGILSQTMKS